MKPQEYIVNELKSFVSKFKAARIGYLFNERSAEHTIEILPKNLFYDNPDYLEWEYGFFNRFIEQFPFDGIGFITSDATVKIKSYDILLEGDVYRVPSIQMNYSVSIPLWKTIAHNQTLDLTKITHLLQEQPMFSTKPMSTNNNYQLAA